MTRQPDDRPYTALGDYIAEGRRKVGISQPELAKRADLSRGLIGDIERGVKRASSNGLLRIARVLDLDGNRALILAEQMEEFKDGATIVVPPEVAGDLQEIAAAPPALIRIAKRMIRDLRTTYMGEMSDPVKSASGEADNADSDGRPDARE